MMLTPTQLNTMLRLQARMNSNVNPDWVAANYPYLRAVVVESGEAIEHSAWKWWKKQAVDVPQLALEIVDILHFVLSEALLRTAQEKNVAQAQGIGLDTMVQEATASLLARLQDEMGSTGFLFDNQTYRYTDLDRQRRLELICGLAVVGRFDLRLLLDAWTDLGRDPAQLFTAYLGKNCLNNFRQANGYKEGTYVKTWDGREDNDHLTDIMNTLPEDASDPEDLVMQGLATRYAAVRAAA